MDSHTTQLLHVSTVEKGAHMLCHEINSTQQLAFTVQIPGKMNHFQTPYLYILRI